MSDRHPANEPRYEPKHECQGDPVSEGVNPSATSMASAPGMPNQSLPVSSTATLNEQQNTTRTRRSSRTTPRTSADTHATKTTGMLPGGQRYFRSRRVRKGEVERPWLAKVDPKEKFNTIIPVSGFILGLLVCALLIWQGYLSVDKYKYCEVLNDDFSSWDPKVWTKEVEVGGYGNGQFEMTTDSDENVFVKDGILTIKPTIQDASLIDNNNVLDLRSKGCTGSKWTDCVASTNTTNGTIINPVKSGRINTKLGASIQFGRVEVTAKLPTGDWLWPAIWMLPTDSKYGEWPRSGEIDIMEGRGNNYTYAQGGNNIVSSTLHFGPNSANDGWWRNNVKRGALHTTYAASWHTFGLEWSDKYIFSYIDTRLLQVMYTHFDEPFWSYGQFPLSDSNGARLQDPWGHTGSKTTPFDQTFYLIMNVAVGGTNGWFGDGKSGKPWIDTSTTAKRDFWEAREQWAPTWEEQGTMQVKSVKIWQQQGYNGCTNSK